MILNDLKTYIEKNPKCSLEELAKHFHLTEDGISAMLAVWIDKGALKVSVAKRNGKENRYYTWVTTLEIGLTVMT